MEQRRSFGDLLKQYRLAAGLTHESLAERSALSARAISDLERGVSRRPRRETVNLLSAALQLAPSEKTAFEAASRASASVPPDGTRTHRGPGSVPVHLTSFVGRQGEVQAVRELLRGRGARLVTLTGPGGAGKSRLAAQVASALTTELQGGARYVELAPVASEDAIVPAIARALGVARADGSAHLADIVEAVQDQELLLVVDNFEHLVAAAPVLTALLHACPRLAVLATSRASLQLSGEHEVAVPPLMVPPRDRPISVEAIGQYASVRLFVDRATYVNAGFSLTAENAGTIAAICARLDGLPLALELAAARTKMLAPRALLERLDGVASGSALRLLTRGTRDVPPHQRTLLATMLWSYTLLTPAEQRLLRRLAIFAGGCTLAAAEVICQSPVDAVDPADDTPLDVLAGLGSLLDKSLLYLEEGPDEEQRFMLLETVREFGLEQLRTSGELDAVARAHAQHFLELAKEIGPLLFADAATLRRSVAEYHNLHEALRWLFHQG
jgi:predicted ATPase/transcriptional regulator with XRE-family HTH domain